MVNHAGDVLDKYEAMRLETAQEHSHVEYCENDIVKLTISSRGQLAKRKIFVPRKSVVHFRNRDRLNTYPLGVSVALNCLSMDAQSDCREDSKVVGINVSSRDSAERHMRSALGRDMEPAGFNSIGLYELKKNARFRANDNINKDDLHYANFEPTDISNKSNLPSLYIRYNSNRFARKDLKRCTWSLYTNEEIRTSLASDCSDLSEWETYLMEFDKLSDEISWRGEFANTCAKL
ncbi:MAG: hypothetical protein ABJO36_03180 [Litorimonas sp.]